jgi:chemotaxis protein methyltransferase CheR
MTADAFDFLARLLKDRSGLVLTRDKAYLIESRLLPVARKRRLKSVDELAAAIRARPNGDLARHVVEAMTTNESSFFRDIAPFEQFRSVVLPALMKSRAAGRQIRIWSAACSSGQEPYTLAMLVAEEQAKLAGWSVEILATDLSAEILVKAEAGLYSQFEVQRGLPIRYLIKYFKPRSERWQIDEGVRERVRFRVFNLLDEPASLGGFDVILCRNVLIYFDQATKARVLGRLADVLAPDGFLFLGGAETVLGISDRFQAAAESRGLYRPVPAAEAPRRAAG